MRYRDKFTAFAQEHREEYLQDLAKLIAIPSVSEELFEASEEAPFGTYCVKALDQMMELCDKYGLQTRTIGKIIGIAEYGEEERELDIVAHLDVQPAGSGWETDPFTLTISGDTAYGRGVSDDKGPALAALYAVRALKELGIPLKKKVRLVWGTGEEYAIMDIRHYTEAEPAPPFMFTPDHTFPIVNGSKSSYTATLSSDFAGGSTDQAMVLQIEGGDNRGAVPGLCTAKVRGVKAELLEQLAEEAQQRTGLPFDMEVDGEVCTLTCRGISTHAVKADHGKSALTAMLQFLSRLPLSESEGHAALKRFALLFPHGDVEGKESGLFVSDEVSGGSLYNVGIFRYSPEYLEAQLRATLPATLKEQNFVPFFRGLAENAGLKVTDDRFSPGSHIPLDDPYIAKLLASYEHYTGQKAFGIAAGGGNYAHYFPHGVAFGCEPYGVDTRMHGAQEFVSIEHMLKSICIFAQAILEICG